MAASIAEPAVEPVRAPAILGLSPGVYGLKIVGLDGPLMSTVDAPAPTLTVTVEVGTTARSTTICWDDRAEIALLNDGLVSLRRDGRAHFTLPRVLSPEELLHPWLVPAAAAFNGWNGRHVLHGGVFAREGRAIAIVGKKEDGKSSLLAWLSQAPDVDILADDLIVVQDNTVFSGPRCIDLRPGSAQQLTRKAGVALVRDGTRLRCKLKPCSPSAILAGIAVLEWGESPRPRFVQLGPASALESLLPHAVNAEVNGGLLDLLGIPVFKLIRPRTWESMPEVVEGLLEVLG